LETKIDMLEVENECLTAKIDLSYSYLSEPQYIDSYKFENYKVGINFPTLYFYEKKEVAWN
jgi:hypothetical protein